jgi:hypothetical protein
MQIIMYNFNATTPTAVNDAWKSLCYKSSSCPNRSQIKVGGREFIVVINETVRAII